MNESKMNIIVLNTSAVKMIFACMLVGKLAYDIGRLKGKSERVKEVKKTEEE